MEEVVVVLVTHPSEEGARALADALLDERLVACANLLPARSLFTWEGERTRVAETLLVLKTVRSRFETLAERVRSLHPYEVPEVIALPCVGVDARYAEWVERAVLPSEPAV